MQILLVPQPRQLKRTSPAYTLSQHGKISIPAPNVLFEGEWIQAVLQEHGYKYDIGVDIPDATVRLRLETALPVQGYQLTVDNTGINIVGGDVAGLFYGLITLRQLLMTNAPRLPGLRIDDQPDFFQRGFMLDVSRDRVPTRATLFQLVDDLAALKFNQLQLYVEHTFAYPGHEIVWEHADPLTPQDILLLDRYCRQRHIELVPNQNSLGHMERWLKHDRYHHLAEAPEGFTSPTGRWRSPSTLAPLEPGSLDLMTSLYNGLLPHFTSQRLNIGCDEPWELGEGKSKASIKAHGGRVYLDWLLKLYRDVKAHGREIMFWGDIIIKYPDLIPELPDDITVMEWGYEANHPFEDHCKRYAEAGIPFYVCPGTSSWNSLVGRTDNAVGNIRSAARHGLEQGAVGLLLTDWGDHGHWQPYPVSYAGMVTAAAVAWGYEQNHNLDLARALDRFVYQDAAEIMGRLTVDLGNIYQQIGPAYINGQVLAYALLWDDLQNGIERIEKWGGAPADISPENLRHTLGEIDRIIAPIQQARMQRSDAALIVREWQQVTALLKHGAKRLLFTQGQAYESSAALLHELDGLIMQQRALWLARSRRGGLEDSMRRFNELRDAYSSDLRQRDNT
jgi:hexosaminidase